MVPYYPVTGTATGESSSATAFVIVVQDSTSAPFWSGPPEEAIKWMDDAAERDWQNSLLFWDFVIRMQSMHRQKSNWILPVAADEKHTLAPTRSMLQRWQE